MTLSLTVPLVGDSIPRRDEWQQEIDKLSLDVRLDPELDLARDSGFSPTTILGRKSGFEIYMVESREPATEWPSIAGSLSGPTRAVCFCWRGDMLECACVLAAAAGLVQRWGRAAVDDNGMAYDGPSLLKEFHACVSEL
jgi:hypothetical protein